MGFSKVETSDAVYSELNDSIVGKREGDVVHSLQSIYFPSFLPDGLFFFPQNSSVCFKKADPTLSPEVGMITSRVIPSP